jgi:ankyrin repeat protein
LLSVLASAPPAIAAGDLRLIDAARSRDVAAVRRLLKQKPDVQARQGDGATALHWAAHWDDVEIASLLIAAGANVNAANDLGVTPLLVACSNGGATMVERLLRAGADPNAVSMSGETPLMLAARTGSTDAVRALLERGARVNASEPSRAQTALMWAAAQRHPDIVRVLLEHGADVHARARVRPTLVNRGDFNTSQLNRIESVDRGGYTALLFAARQGDIEASRLLLDAGADANESAPDGTSVLHLATHSGHTALAKFLLDRGANPNAAASGYTPLHAAVLRGDLEAVKALLAHGADVNALITKGNPLRRFGSQEFVLPAFLVGSTPFLLAARYAEIDILRVLADAGANPKTAMPDGTTALMLASGVGWNDTGVGGSADRRGRFLPAGTPTAGVPDWSRTAAAVELVARLGVDPAAANASGETALHGAASKGFDSVVEFLVARGARLDAKNKRGATPLGLALGREEFKSTADLLRKLGAQQ